MFPIGRQLSLAGFLLSMFAHSAFGGVYADPSGFSFTYPDDWVAINRQTLGDVNQALPQAAKDWVARNNVDLNRIAVVLLRDGREGFLDNLNVVIENQQIPINEEALKRLTDELVPRYRAMNVTVDDLRGRVQKFGSRDGLVMDYQSKMPGVPFPLRQRQVMLPGGGKTYIITCSAKTDTFDKHQATFEGVVASFQAPAPIVIGFDWNQVGKNAAVWGIAGGVIGGLVAIIRKFTGKSKLPG